MTTYAEFYHNSTGYIDGTIPPQFSAEHIKPIPACGDRSIIWLDGRMSRCNMHYIAAEECAKRGFIGYKLIKGESLSNASAITEYVEV